MKDRKPISLKWGVLTMILLCWVLPIVMIVTTAGMLLNRSYEKNLQAAMQESVSHAMEQTVLRCSAAMESSKAVSYTGEVRSAYRAYQRDGDRLALYNTVTSFFSQNYARDENFKAVFLTFYDNPEDLYYYAASYRTTSYSLVRDYRETVWPAVETQLSAVDTGIYFIEVGGEVYMIRNLLDSQFRPYAALVMRCDMDTLCQAFAVITNVSHVAITLDGVPWLLVDTQPEPARDARVVTLEQEATFAGHTLTVETSALRHDLWGAMPGLRTAVGLLLLFVLPLLLGFIWLFSHYVTIPMQQISEASAHVQNGERGYQIPGRASSREFDQLYEHFNRMSAELQRQFERLYREQQALQHARIKALQSQINPHFLNNTLEIINWQARLADNEQVCKMVDALSTMLDGALGRDGQGMVPLATELGYVDAYLYIIRERLGERLHIEKQIDQALLDTVIPRLILQPIVENAVEHDLVPRRGGHLTLRAYRDGRMLVMQAVHDGTLSWEDRAKIEQILQPQEDGPGRVGLSNVCERLRLLYGERAHLRIRQEADACVLAEIVLPLDAG